MVHGMEAGAVPPDANSEASGAEPKLTPLELLRAAEAGGDPWEIFAASARVQAYYQGNRQPTPIEILKAAEAGGDPREILDAKVAFYRDSMNAWPPCYESEYAELMGRPFQQAVQLEPVTSQAEQLTD